MKKNGIIKIILYGDTNTRYYSSAIYNWEIKHTDKYFYINDKIYLNDDLWNLNAWLTAESFFGKLQILIWWWCLQADWNWEWKKSSSCPKNLFDLGLLYLNSKLDYSDKLIIYKNDWIYPYWDDPRDSEMIEKGYYMNSNYMNSIFFNSIKDLLKNEN